MTTAGQAQVTGAALSIDKPGFLFARVHQEPGLPANLLVYRSPMVDGRYPPYHDVHNFVVLGGWRLTHTEEYKDIRMMQHTGILEVYSLD